MAVDTQAFARAKLELALLIAEAESIRSSEFYAWLRDQGIPESTAIRLKSLVELVVKTGTNSLNVGKALVVRVIAFVQAHPHLVAGAAIGAALSALVAAVPLIGPALAPFAATLGFAIGAVAGHRIDQGRVGAGVDPITLAADAIGIAASFFKLLIDLLKIVITGPTS